jgi:hypothetical protein
MIVIALVVAIIAILTGVIFWGRCIAIRQERAMWDEDL